MFFCLLSGIKVKLVDKMMQNKYLCVTLHVKRKKILILTVFTQTQLFERRLALNPGLNLTLVSFSCVQKHFLG